MHTWSSWWQFVSVDDNASKFTAHGGSCKCRSCTLMAWLAHWHPSFKYQTLQTLQTHQTHHNHQILHSDPRRLWFVFSQPARCCLFLPSDINSLSSQELSSLSNCCIAWYWFLGLREIHELI